MADSMSMVSPQPRVRYMGGMHIVSLLTVLKFAYSRYA
jgi:hypothetical protein